MLNHLFVNLQEDWAYQLLLIKDTSFSKLRAKYDKVKGTSRESEEVNESFATFYIEITAQ